MADLSHTNGQCEVVPGPMFNPEFEGKTCASVVAFCAICCLHGYWQCPLAELAREYFSFVTRDGPYIPTRMPQGVMSVTSYFHGIVPCSSRARMVYYGHEVV